MELVLSSPLRAATLGWEQQRGEPMLTVVCKATFELKPGEARLAENQDDINEEANHWNDDPNRSVYSPNDLAPYKPRADVLLVGHAFAAGDPVRSLVARMIVGGVDKSIEVHADRVFSQDGLLREGSRFLKMPLRYERAAGGSESWNPVGIAADGRRDAYGNAPLPNLQPPGLLVSEPGHFIEPIGFGPIAPRWPERMDLLGAYAEGFRDATWNKAPLPPDLDFSYWNCAPRDQQVDELRDNERIILENLHAKHARLVTSLPGLRPTVSIERAGGHVDLPLRCDTLWIDTDRSIATLVWRGQTRLAHANEAVRVHVGMETDAEPYSEPPASPNTRAVIDLSELGTDGGDETDASAVMPFPHTDHPKREAASTMRDLQTKRQSRAELGIGDASPAWLNQQRPPPTTSPVMPAMTPAPAMAAPPPMMSSAMPSAPMPSAPMPSPIAHPPPVPRSSEPAPIAPPVVVSPWAGAAPSAPVTPSAAATPWANPSARNEATPSPTSPRAAPSSQTQSRPPVVPFVSSATVAQAATSGAVAASDAAAAAARAAAAAKAMDAPHIADDRPATRAPYVADPVELLWFNPKSVARMRAWWRDVVTGLEFEDDDPRHDFPSDDPESDKDRRVVFGLLTEVRAEDAIGVARAVLEAVSAKGRFTPPLVVVSGDLRFPFDDVESLKAIVGSITPVIGGDKKLKEQVDTVSELLKTPYLQGSNGVVQKIEQQLQEQLNQTNKNLPGNYIELNVERMLLEQRHYQKRKVFGEPWLRALLHAGASDNAFPAYLPEAVADKLPMAVTMRARLIAEVVPQQDQYETHAYALKVHALGRVLRLDRRG